MLDIELLEQKNQGDPDPMPRYLTSQQKNAIDRTVNRLDPNTMSGSHDDLTSTELEVIIAMNDYETVYQDIDRHIWDNMTQRRFAK